MGRGEGLEKGLKELGVEEGQGTESQLGTTQGLCAGLPCLPACPALLDTMDGAVRAAPHPRHKLTPVTPLLGDDAWPVPQGSTSRLSRSSMRLQGYEYPPVRNGSLAWRP